MPLKGTHIYFGHKKIDQKMIDHPLSLHTYASKILEPILFPILWLLNVCIMTFALFCKIKYAQN